MLLGLRRFILCEAELQTARELDEQLFALAQRPQDFGPSCRGHLCHGSGLALSRRVCPGPRTREQGIALYEDPGAAFALAMPHLYGHDTGCSLSSLVARSECLGYPDQALKGPRGAHGPRDVSPD